LPRLRQAWRLSQREPTQTCGIGIKGGTTFRVGARADVQLLESGGDGKAVLIVAANRIPASLRVSWPRRCLHPKPSPQRQVSCGSLLTTEEATRGYPPEAAARTSRARHRRSRPCS
jgi:hypothetical protein